MEGLDDMICDICLEQYNLDERKPMIICSNGHSSCVTCSQALSRRLKCPICNTNVLECGPIVNRALMNFIESIQAACDRIPGISAEDLNLEPVPFASGAQADLYRATWSGHLVAVKIIRAGSNQAGIEALKREARLLIGLHHPNIIRVYGTVNNKLPGKVSIVMDYTEHGSLLEHMSSLHETREECIRLALEIVYALEFLHQHKIVHRDITPQNILLRKSHGKLHACISDFGISRVLQTINLVTSSIGTPAYTPPEMFAGQGTVYGPAVDIYSLSMLLYHLFTGCEPFPNRTTMQIMYTVAIDRSRPALDRLNDLQHSKFSAVIRRGWDHEPNNRPRLYEFREALLELSGERSSMLLDQEPIAQPKKAKLTMEEQSKKSDFLPVPSCMWNVANCVQAQRMVDVMQRESTFSRIFHRSVLQAMRLVPRDLFAHYPDDMDNIYAYFRSMQATEHSRESSPEIVAAQLSLIKIEPGDVVVVIGGKGGYIQSVIAQIVGLRGKVISYSGNQHVLNLCKARCDRYSPFSHVMEWKHLPMVEDWEALASDMTRISGRPVSSVIFTGVVSKLPLSIVRLTLRGTIAPVIISSAGQQQFVVASKIEQSIISDWGVRFGVVV